MIPLKTIGKKALCFALVIILCFAPALSVAGLAVTFPEGVTQADCEAAIPKLDKVIPAAVALTGKSLDEALYESVITDATLNGLFKSVYSEMAGNASTLNLMGVNVSPAALAEALSDYPAVSQKIAGLSSLEDALSVCDSFQWGVSSKSGFASAVAAMFSPFNRLLNAILCGGTAQINLLLAIKGDDGYGNTVVPLLKVLGCPSIMSSSDFAAAAAENRNSMVRNIVLMLFSAVDNLLAAPGTGICSTLPGLAWYIQSGKLSEAVKSLTDPLALRIGIVTVPGIPALLANITNLQGMDLSAMIGDIDLSKMTGGENATLKLAEMDMAKLAACGKEADGVFTPDRPAALLTVMDWLVKTMKLNGDAFTADDENAAKLIKPLLEKSDEDLVKALLLLLGENKETFSNPYKWTYKEYKSDEILSTPNLTLDDYAAVLEKIDPFLDEVAAEKDPDATIADTIRPLIYSNSLLGTITSALYGALNGEEAQALLPILGLNASPAGVADAIAGSHHSAAQTLRSLASWDQLTANSIDFGFENGDRNGFKQALTDVLSPFAPIFRYLFAEGTITLLGGITLNGSDGYNSVIIPILEALGCPASDIKTYAQYKMTAENSVITDIIEPILALLDQICEKPVKTACAKLPNIVYFLYNDGLKNCLSNLLYPITAKLDQIGLSGLLSGDLIDPSMLDIDSLVEKLAASADLQIKLVKPNLKRLESFGRQQTLVSKRTADGAQTVYTYIEANSPAVLLTALRYLVSTLSLEENSEALGSLMGSLMASQSEAADPDKPDMMAMYTDSIGEKFKGMTTDEIIEWLYDLLFRETPKVATETDFIPTIIYEKEHSRHPLVAIIVIVALLVLAVLVLRYLDKRKKFEKLKEKRREKRELKNRKRIEAGKPPKQKKEKKPKKETAEKPVKEKRKKLTKQEKLLAKNAAIEEKLRKKAMQTAKPVQKPQPGPAPQAAPAAKPQPPRPVPAPAATPEAQPYLPAKTPAQAHSKEPVRTQQATHPVQKNARPAGAPVQQPHSSRPNAVPHPDRTPQRPQPAPTKSPAYAPGSPHADRYPVPGTPAGRPAPAISRNQFEASVTMSQKRANQLNKAQAKAAKEARKNQAKTERIYAKAMKNANKNQKGGRK